jgi:hypothetical protein
VRTLFTKSAYARAPLNEKLQMPHRDASRDVVQLDISEDFNYVYIYESVVPCRQASRVLLLSLTTRSSCD